MNQWYAFTYEAILDLADWATLEADVEKKIVGIYSWMPQTIMKLRMPENRYMCDVFSIENVREAARQSSIHIAQLNGLTLQNIDLEENSVVISNILAPMFNVLGSVAASKYFHFSRPLLFPMWDATLRKKAGLENSPNGFIQYMQVFKAELNVPENVNAATQRYPENLVRGWDMVRMENRNA